MCCQRCSSASSLGGPACIRDEQLCTPYNSLPRPLHRYSHQTQARCLRRPAKGSTVHAAAAEQQEPERGGRRYQENCTPGLEAPQAACNISPTPHGCKPQVKAQHDSYTHVGRLEEEPPWSSWVASSSGAAHARSGGAAHARSFATHASSGGALSGAAAAYGSGACAGKADTGPVQTAS